jgi:hypothetical protein
VFWQGVTLGVIVLVGVNEGVKLDVIVIDGVTCGEQNKQSKKLPLKIFCKEFDGDENILPAYVTQTPLLSITALKVAPELKGIDSPTIYC